jgi:predicted aconitase
MELAVEAEKPFGAEPPITVASAHILGHYGSPHQAGIDFLECLQMTLECLAPTTVNPSSANFERRKPFKIPQDQVEKQERPRQAPHRVPLSVATVQA